MKLDKDEIILLLEINEYSENGGVTINELNRVKSIKHKLDYSKFFHITEKLKKLHLIDEIPNPEETGCPRYILTKDGLKELNKQRIKIGERVDLIESLPPEISLKYRIENIESLIIIGVLSGLTYLLLIKNLTKMNIFLQMMSIALVTILWTFFIINLVEIMIIPLFGVLNKIIKLTKKNMESIKKILIIIGIIGGGVIFYLKFRNEFWIYILTIVLKWLWDLFWKKIKKKKED